MMTANFNSIFRAVAMTATLALALPVFGQTLTRVNIPLDFEMGSHSMSAGATCWVMADRYTAARRRRSRATRQSVRKEIVIG